MKLLALGLFWSFTSFGADVFNVGLQVRFEYSDLDSHCKLSALVMPYRLGAELEEGRVVRTRISRSLPGRETLTYDLNEDELRGVEIREEAGLMWLKSLSVSEEMLKLFIYAGEGFRSDTCVPPRGISSMNPNSALFDFGVEEVGYLLPAFFSSNEVIIKGQTQASNPYQINLSLVQDRR